MWPLIAFIIALCISWGPEGAGAAPDRSMAKRLRALGKSIKSDERLHLFPAYAAQRADGGWRGTVRGWVYEPEAGSLTRRLAIEALGKTIRVHPKHPKWPTFEARIRWFMVDNERGKRVGVMVGDQLVVGETGRDGHFAETVTLGESWTPPADGRPGVRPMKSVPSTDGRVSSAPLFLVPWQGLSVISDIDDTVKVTQVLDLSAMIANTFLESFVAVPGMAALYQGWRAQGAMFHFLSSSPRQLQPLLAQFLAEAGFPEATFHLRTVRLKDRSLLGLFASSTETKPPQIEAILRDFPGRRFILVGDSGEHDPEIYGGVARAHPKQIEHIYIRRVPRDRGQAGRFERAFSGVAPHRWTVFEDASALGGGRADSAAPP